MPRPVTSVTGFAMTPFTRSVVQVRAGGQGRPPLRRGQEAQGRRDDVRSKSSAAGGGGSEMSEWPRSKFPASAVRQRRNFGHRNRVIGPYGELQGVRYKAGRRAEGSPSYKFDFVRGDGRGRTPPLRITRGAVGRADVGIGPYGGVTRSAVQGRRGGRLCPPGA